MQKIVIEGGKKITGEIAVHGAKNSALPLLAATILSGEKTVLHNCPKLSDAFAACRILSYLGCKCERENSDVMVDTSGLKHFEVPDELMREMRSSIVFLGAILGRIGKCRLSFPGGCDLGARPIDIHLSALKQMGVKITEEHGFLYCIVEKKLKGAKINLSLPSVGATENIILAAVLAEGDTEIHNAAREPEIKELANFLNLCGAKIRGQGGSSIYISGVDKLHGCEYSVMPDRIVASTYLAAAAITSGEIVIKKADASDLQAVLTVFEEMGCKTYLYNDKIALKSPEILKPVKRIYTSPFPGFPTDVQAIVCACLAKADGTSVIVENIFDNRFKYAGELRRMGADIKVEGKIAVIEGVKKMYGATVFATDLRAGAALILAGLVAEGKTEVFDIKYIDRGYEEIEKNLSLIGGKVERK